MDEPIFEHSISACLLFRELIKAKSLIFLKYNICHRKKYSKFKSSKHAPLLLRVGVRLWNFGVGLQLDKTVPNLLHNLGLLHHLDAGVELLVGQRLVVIDAPLLLHLLRGSNEVPDQPDRLPVRGVVAFKAGVDELAEVVEPLAVHSKLPQTAALWPEVDGRGGPTEMGKDKTLNSISSEEK